MIRYYLIIAIISLISINLKGQTFSSKSGMVSFYSDARKESNEFHNKQLEIKLNANTGALEFRFLMKTFESENPLALQIFHQDFMQSAQFPEVTFQGQILNFNKGHLNTPGIYPVGLKGTINLHGVPKQITEKGTLIVEGDRIDSNFKFYLKPIDFDIKIPIVLKDIIAQVILVKIKADLSQ